MTDISKEAVDALLQDVTAGPWRIGRNIAFDVFYEDGKLVATTYDNAANARFIAAVRELVPALRAALDEAEARATDYEDQIANLLPAVNREAVEQRTRAVKAEAESIARRQIGLTRPVALAKGAANDRA